ncbi:ribose-5-phosphate isomerase RpiA [Methanoplanus endosymbiosus]|uniref:Ribose-5-phosphate isomerase A n=1 Tax=Methanoplanus endosymbiosus TaxID=33865 RepID=A0A9E7PQ98_9EURY|nr:ribose-5-phosphate isomerase RpiA [Methanoplanus endosymbiosus]UUX93437.1 ribose-5-phosphate isomerase RpiA [Methanoplanus endosymbiosus]
MTDANIMKKNAGYYAAELVEDGMIVGLGTGSTVFFAMEKISAMINEGLDIVGVPTSYQAMRRAREYGIPLGTLDDYPTLDLAIDGADQIDPKLRMIKGRGAAQTMEKCVCDAADSFIVVSDPSKLSDRLDAVVPVEVIPFACSTMMETIRKLGGVPVVREGVKKDGPVITDSGNFEIDCSFGVISDPENLESRLNNIPGVLSCGLFTQYSSKTKVVIGKKNDVEVILLGD